jgi:hypothetical protein
LVHGFIDFNPCLAGSIAFARNIMLEGPSRGKLFTSWQLESLWHGVKGEEIERENERKGLEQDIHFTSYVLS